MTDDTIIPPDDEPAPDVLPELPDAWPFLVTAGEGEI